MRPLTLQLTRTNPANSPTRRCWGHGDEPDPRRGRWGLSGLQLGAGHGFRLQRPGEPRDLHRHGGPLSVVLHVHPGRRVCSILVSKRYSSLSNHQSKLLTFLFWKQEPSSTSSTSYVIGNYPARSQNVYFIRHDLPGGTTLTVLSNLPSTILTSCSTRNRTNQTARLSSAKMTNGFSQVWNLSV